MKTLLQTPSGAGRPTPPERPCPPGRLYLLAAAGLGVLAFLVTLLYHNVADGDLWARLAAGAAVFRTGNVLPRDIFAFSATLPRWIDHEWGAGVLFFGCLKFLGPQALMALKVLLAFGCLGAAVSCGRRAGANRLAMLLLAVPAALTILPGYVPVIRSHALTYFFFSLTLLLLEDARRRNRHHRLLILLILLIWANVHGGFVAGLGLIGVYAGVACLQRRHGVALLITLAGALAVTFINPYGFKFWVYLVPALLHPRTDIAEWAPMPFRGDSSFVFFWFLLGMALLVLVGGWRDREREDRSWAGLLMLFLTAFLAIRSRRHAPFFGITALAMLGPYLSAVCRRMLRTGSGDGRPPSTWPARIVFLVYAGLAAFVGCRLLPSAHPQVLAPVGFYPVREVDILAHSHAAGNLAVPFRWGSYAMWRLYPDIKVSVDGRYEETYPESTFRMNLDFYSRRGGDWDRLLKMHPIDYVIVETGQTALRPEDLTSRGYVMVWSHPAGSALFVHREKLDTIRKAMATLPEATVQPLDARIPEAWPELQARVP